MDRAFLTTSQVSEGFSFGQLFCWLARTHPASQERLECAERRRILDTAHVGEDQYRLEWFYRGVRSNFYEATGGRGTITMDDLSHFQRDASAKRLVPSSFGTPLPPIVDRRE